MLVVEQRKQTSLFVNTPNVHHKAYPSQKDLVNDLAEEIKPTGLLDRADRLSCHVLQQSFVEV